MASPAPRRLTRPRSVFDPPVVKVTDDGRVDKADFDHFVRTLTEYTRSRPDQMEGLRLPGYDFSNSPSASVGAETVVLTILGFTFEEGAAYRVSSGNTTQTGTANAEATLRVRRTNAAGTLWVVGGRVAMPTINQAFNNNVQGFLYREAGAGNLTTNVVLTLEGIGGNVVQQASTNNIRYLSIEYAGLAVDYPFARVVR